MKVLAAIFAIAILAKISLLIISPGRYKDFTEKLLKNYQRQAMLIYSILTVVVGFFIFLKLNIINIAGVMLFTSLLIGIGLIPYTNAMINLRDEVLTQGSPPISRETTSQKKFSGTGLWPVGTACSAKRLPYRLEACTTHAIVFYFSFQQEEASFQWPLRR